MTVVRAILQGLSGWLPGRLSTTPGDDQRAGSSAHRTTATTPREERALRRARAVSHLLDEAVELPVVGYRVGIDPILGVLPVAGDSVATVLSLYPILEGYRLGVSRRALLGMVLRVGIDSVLGSIPVLGTLFDAGWKANVRNVRRIEAHLEAD